MDLGEKYFLKQSCKMTQRTQRSSYKKYFLVLEASVSPQNAVIIEDAPYYKWLRTHRTLPVSQSFIPSGAPSNSFDN